MFIGSREKGGIRSDVVNQNLVTGPGVDKESKSEAGAEGNDLMKGSNCRRLQGFFC